MKAFFEQALRQLLVLLLSASVAFAQTPAARRNAPATQQELDQMLAPIALYPDSLLSQIFMASTYPLEVVEAARWGRANPGLTGEAAVNAVGERDWDASVKSLAAFPQVLAMMDQQLEWTARLGDVFIAQEPQVMETVQLLRQRAYDAGNLRSTEQAYVSRQGEFFAIEPVSPQVVYVPYYDARVAYGPWWWSEYPPVYWAPWPGYYARPGHAVVFAWGPGIMVSSGFFFSACDWRARRITVVHVIGNRPVRTGQPVIWQHDPGHRRGVPYHIRSVQQRFGGSTQAGQRREFRWQDPVAPATRNSALNRPEVHGTNPRPNVPGTDRPNPRRDGRPDGRGFSANPGAAARPEIHGRPPAVSVPQGNAPHSQRPAPQPGAGHGQAGNRPAPGAGKGHGDRQGR